MTLRVRFRPQAITDVDEAANWYEARRPGLGKEFRLALDAVIELIQQNPALRSRMEQRGEPRCVAFHTP